MMSIAARRELLVTVASRYRQAAPRAYKAHTARVPRTCAPTERAAERARSKHISCGRWVLPCATRFLGAGTTPRCFRKGLTGPP